MRKQFNTIDQGVAARCRSLVLAVVLGITLLAAGNGEAANTLVITETTGTNQTNYPVTFGRGFAEGEIANFPQALVNNTTIQTQADVKNRWSDGSVKFAVISFIVPQLFANQALNVSFQNTTTNPNSGFLTQAQMLASSFSFDARTELTQGSSTVSASARQMLQNGHFSYWLQGPVVTSIILADHSTGRAFDIGFDSHRPFRPIFHADFYPSINKVRVRYIGENANTQAAEDISYNLTLRLSSGNQTVYTKSGVSHHAFSRWTKVFWINGTPVDVEIDQNLQYLVESKFLPSYDLNLQVPESVVSSLYNSWQGSAHDLFDNSLIQKHMPSSGGRDDIGPFPRWHTLYFYTWDVRLKNVMFNLADLGAAFPMHFREGSSRPGYNKNSAIDGIGRGICIDLRPSLLLFDSNGYMNASFTSTNDRINVVGPITDNEWHLDFSHQPNLYFGPYLVSGDYWYLEQMLIWAQRGAFHMNPVYARGGNGTMGGMDGDQLRGQAWQFRLRTEAAFLAPDGTPEADYLRRLMQDAIAIYEGHRGLTGTPMSSTAEYQWGLSSQNGYWGGKGNPALRFWTNGNAVSSAASTSVNASAVSSIVAPWESGFMLYSLGRARELGYPTQHLVSWLGQYFIGQITDSSFSPYYIAAYQTPAVSTATGQWYSTWQAVRTGFTTTWDPQAAYEGQFGDTGHGYPHIARAGISMVASEPQGGSVAWSFMLPVRQVAALNNNPKWAINARGTVSGPGWTPTPTPTPGPSTTPTPTPTPSPSSTPTPTPTPTPSSSPTPTPTPGSGSFSLTIGLGGGGTGGLNQLNADTVTFYFELTGATASPNDQVLVLGGDPGQTNIVYNGQNLQLPFLWNGLTDSLASQPVALGTGQKTLVIPPDTQPFTTSFVAVLIPASGSIRVSNNITLELSNLEEAPSFPSPGIEAPTSAEDTPDMGACSAASRASGIDLGMVFMMFAPSLILWVRRRQLPLQDLT